MKRKSLRYFTLLLFAVVAMTITALELNNPTYAYTAGEKACAKFTWNGKEYQGGLANSDTKDTANATITLCTSKVDSAGNIDGDVSVSYSGDAQKYIADIKTNGDKLEVHCITEGLLTTLDSKVCATVDASKGQSFKDFILGVSSTLQSVRGQVTLPVSATSQNSRVYTLKDSISWDPTMDASDNNTIGRTGVSGGKVGESDIGGENGDDQNNNDPEENICYTAAGAVGWGLCPVIQKISEALKGLYRDMVEPFLVIKADVLNNSSGTYKAWSTFRDIANIIFVMLLLAVILSQVTGVGINNYGIKKMLPKLIIAAVLINLSFLICQLAVDISNILGASLNAFFTKIAQDIRSFSDSAELFDDISGVIFATIGFVAAGGAIAAIALDIEGVKMLLLPILCAVISAILAIVFFYVMLGARQAGVIILVAISPVALACYILPNTKSLFDKWLKIFKGLLVIYPIAGLLIGGGTLAAAILTANPGDGVSGFLIYLIALSLMVIPFFLLPKLIKGSMNVMGNIGNTLTGMGQRSGARLSGLAGNKMKSSEKYQDWERQSTNNRLSRKLNSLEKRRNAGNLSLAGERRMASLTASLDKMEQEDINAGLLNMQNRGIIMADGSPAEFTLPNAVRRMAELRDVANRGELSKQQRREMQSLAVGLSNMKGGASQLGNLMRGSAMGEDGKLSKTNRIEGSNEGFMQEIGQIYASNSTVQSKLNEKDKGASMYAEQFMPGADRNNRFATFDDYKAGTDYYTNLKGRTPSYRMGLTQGGTAAHEYLNTLQLEDLDSIVNDKNMLSAIAENDSSIRDAVVARHAALTEARTREGRTGYDPNGPGGADAIPE